MSHFVWRDEYRTGRADIDAQHEHLFALAELLAEPEPAEDMRVHVLELFKHTREHFGTEEALMKASHYPGYREHVAMHDVLLDMLVNLSQEIHDNRCTNELLMDIAQWFVDHIREVDSLLAGYLAAQADALPADDQD
jgi:hemerythrin